MLVCDFRSGCEDSTVLLQPGFSARHVLSSQLIGGDALTATTTYSNASSQNSNRAWYSQKPETFTKGAFAVVKSIL